LRKNRAESKLSERKTKLNKEIKEKEKFPIAGIPKTKSGQGHDSYRKDTATHTKRREFDAAIVLRHVTLRKRANPNQKNTPHNQNLNFSQQDSFWFPSVSFSQHNILTVLSIHSCL
jgi:hypothetical protein